MFWKKKTEAAAPHPATPPPLPAQATRSEPAALQQQPLRLGEGHPGKFDHPKNPLEISLMALRARQIDVPSFLEELFNSKIFVVPKKEDIVASDTGLSLGKNPHLFSITYPEYVALGLYTSPERAKPTSDQYPEYRFAFEVHAGDFLMNLGGDFGIVLNPYWDVNIEFSNVVFQRVLTMMHRD